ncbi:MAG: putative selenium-dependent hydroxylase accessory protein YqeC [Chloroflexi bacterium]|nr:putative selenium-dependent hydroxylase accessory protein YqeC [Chloroflexota bacterium]
MITLSAISTRSLREALGIRPKEIISIVGAGGKTTLMFALGKELAEPGKMVVTTTTTKILEPDPSQSERVFLSPHKEEIIAFLTQQEGVRRLVTIATDVLPSAKLKGIEPSWVEDIIRIPHVGWVLVEADGAAHRSLKAPNATEPVIPECTTLVIPVVGIDALGCPLLDEFVFRASIAAQLLGSSSDHAISARDMATLLTHREGIARGTPSTARIVPFVNKTDLASGMRRAHQVASAIMDRKHPQISRVVLGQAQNPQAETEIVLAPENS